MGSIYLVLCGLGCAGVIRFLRKTAAAWYQWIVVIALYGWICLGISFVYINSVGYHHQAARVGALFFGIVALAWAFLAARLLGFLGTKKMTRERV